jgi:hypothetical protein
MLLTRTSLASIIIKSIAETFFGKKPGYIMRQRRGALQAVAKYTTPYISTVMVHGQRKAIKFEGDDMEGKLYISQLYYGYWVLISIFNIMIAVYQNLHTAWYKQSPKRRTRLLTLLLDRIQDYVGLKPEEYDPKAIASIPNLYKNRMDDLDELEVVGQARDEEEEAELDF